MIDQNVLDALQEQYNRERKNGVAYEGAAAMFGEMGLDGFEAWCLREGAAELEHARAFYCHIQNVGGTPVVGSLSAPAAIDTGDGVALSAVALSIMTAILETEEANAGALSGIYKLGEPQTCAFLIDVIRDQSRDIGELSTLVGRVEYADDRDGLLTINSELRG